MTKRIVIQHSRWPIKQVAENVVEVHIPLGDGPTILNPEFVELHRLNDKDIEEAEFQVLNTMIWTS
jgi:hypothetical protein